MLLIPTNPESVTLVNVAEHLLLSTPCSLQKALGLVEMLQANKSSLDVRIRLAKALVDNNQVDHAKELTFDFDEILVRNKLSYQQIANAVKVLAALGRIKLALNIIKIKYVENPDIQNWYAIVGWEYYHRKRDYKNALALMLKDYDSHRLSLQWMLRLATEFTFNECFDEAKHIIKKAYKCLPKLRGGFGAVGWHLFLNNNFSEALTFFTKDSELNRLKDSQLWQYALSVLHSGDEARAKLILKKVRCNEEKALFGHYITRLYNMGEINCPSLSISIGTLENILSYGHYEVRVVENLIRQYYFVGKIDKSFEVLSLWEKHDNSEKLFIPRLALAVNTMRDDQRQYTARLLQGLTPEILNCQRSLFLYLICTVVSNQTDLLKRGVELLYIKYPSTFRENPHRCLMFSLVAHKFGENTLFKRCIEIGRIHKENFDKLYPWILKTIKNMEQIELNLPGFKFPSETCNATAKNLILS